MITLITTVLALVVFFVLRKVGSSLDKNSDHLAMVKGGSILSLILAILLPLGVGFYATFRTIPAGSVGVSTLFGAVRETPLHEGFNLTMPLVEVTNMSVQIQKHSANYLAASKDMQVVHIDMVLNFRLRPEKAPDVFKNIGPDYSNVIIDPAAQEVVKAEMALHNASDILASRPKVKDQVQEKLKTWMDKYGVELTEVSIANVKFDPAYEKAIEAKQVQQQVAEQRSYELQQAQKEAEIAAAKAKGLADSRKIQAEGEADYNKKVSASITPEIIKMEYLKRWDGKLPSVLSDSKGSMIFTVDSGRATEQGK